MIHLKPLLLTAKDHIWRHRVAIFVLFFGMLLPLMLLEDIMEGVHENKSWPLDTQILHFMHTHASPNRDFVVFWATKFGYWVALPLLFGGAWFLRHIRNTRSAAYFVITVAGAWIMDGVVKLFFGRTRPDLWTSILPEKSFSFPSGHSMISAALGFAVVALLWRTRWRWFAVVLAPPSVILVGLSRLYLGVHYPSDVLGGWLAGLAWATGIYLIFRPLQPATSPVSNSA